MSSAVSPLAYANATRDTKERMEIRFKQPNAISQISHVSSVQANGFIWD